MSQTHMTINGNPHPVNFDGPIHVVYVDDYSDETLLVFSSKEMAVRARDKIRGLVGHLHSHRIMMTTFREDWGGEEEK